MIEGCSLLRLWSVISMSAETCQEQGVYIGKGEHSPAEMPSMVDQSCSNLSSRNAALAKPAIKLNKNGKKSNCKLLCWQGSNRLT